MRTKVEKFFDLISIHLTGWELITNSVLLHNRKDLCISFTASFRKSEIKDKDVEIILQYEQYTSRLNIGHLHFHIKDKPEDVAKQIWSSVLPFLKKKEREMKMYEENSRYVPVDVELVSVQSDVNENSENLLIIKDGDFISELNLLIREIEFFAKEKEDYYDDEQAYYDCEDYHDHTEFVSMVMTSNHTKFITDFIENYLEEAQQEVFVIQDFIIAEDWAGQIKQGYYPCFKIKKNLTEREVLILKQKKADATEEQAFTVGIEKFCLNKEKNLSSFLRIKSWEKFCSENEQNDFEIKNIKYLGILGRNCDYYLSPPLKDWEAIISIPLKEAWDRRLPPISTVEELKIVFSLFCFKEKGKKAPAFPTWKKTSKNLIYACSSCSSWAWEERLKIINASIMGDLQLTYFSFNHTFVVRYGPRYDYLTEMQVL